MFPIFIYYLSIVKGLCKFSPFFNLFWKCAFISKVLFTKWWEKLLSLNFCFLIAISCFAFFCYNCECGSWNVYIRKLPFWLKISAGEWLCHWLWSKAVSINLAFFILVTFLKSCSENRSLRAINGQHSLHLVTALNWIPKLIWTLWVHVYR